MKRRKIYEIVPEGGSRGSVGMSEPFGKGPSLPIHDELIEKLEECRRRHKENWPKPQPIQIAQAVIDVARTLNEYWGKEVEPFLGRLPYKSSRELLQDFVGDEFKSKGGAEVRYGHKWMKGEMSTKDFVEWIGSRIMRSLG
jgi:hypothetical protein